MDIIKSYKIFERELAYLTKPIEIRFDITQSNHYFKDSKWRHGYEGMITDEEVSEMVDKAMEQLTIDLMSDRLAMDEKFMLTDGHLNLICALAPGEMYFTLNIVSAMRKENYLPHNNQYVLDVNTMKRYWF